MVLRSNRASRRAGCGTTLWCSCCVAMGPCSMPQQARLVTSWWATKVEPDQTEEGNRDEQHSQAPHLGAGPGEPRTIT